MQEIWKDVVGYEGIYQVSSLGNLKSCDMYVLARNGKRRKVKGKILKKRYAKWIYSICALQRWR